MHECILVASSTALCLPFVSLSIRRAWFFVLISFRLALNSVSRVSQGCVYFWKVEIYVVMNLSNYGPWLKLKMPTFAYKLNYRTESTRKCLLLHVSHT